MLIKIGILLIVLTELSLPLAAQWAQRPTAGIPRTADGKPNLTAPAPRAVDGKPDLSGIWAVRSSLADYKSDYGKPWVQALVQRRAENYGKDNPAFQCLPQGPGYSTAQVSSKQIIQTPAMILILNDDLTYRRIFMDSRVRTVEWCEISGFEQWWRRLARGRKENLLRGGIEEPVLAAYWLFNIVRSEYAITLRRFSLGFTGFEPEWHGTRERSGDIDPILWQSVWT